VAYDSVNDTILIQNVDSVDIFSNDFPAAESSIELLVVTTVPDNSNLINLDPFFTVGSKRSTITAGFNAVLTEPAFSQVLNATVPANFVDLDQSSEEKILIPYNLNAIQIENFYEQTLYVTNTFTVVPLDPKSTLGVTTGGTGGTGGSTRIQYWT
jgi:hypothetical protein